MRTGGSAPGPEGYEAFGREQWSRHSRTTAPGPEAPVLFDDAARAAEAASGGPVDPDEVQEIYLPLARWIEQRVAERGAPGQDPDGDDGAHLHRATTVIGITGSVAAGKTTTARVLVGLLRRGPGRPTVDLLTTDGFLFPNRVLEQRGLLGRKGFPETYDQPALVAALQAVRSGQAEVGVPVYSHHRYDIVPGELQWICRPDLLVVEGLTVLQGGSGGVDPGDQGVEPLIDLSVYVHADEDALAHWHTERLLGLRATTGDPPSEFLLWFASLTDAQADQVAASSWTEINLVNLRNHVAPTRGRADVILEKDADHRVRSVLVRPERAPTDRG